MPNCRAVEYICEPTKGEIYRHARGSPLSSAKYDFCAYIGYNIAIIANVKYVVNRIGALGLSLGGEVGLQAAAMDSRIAALVSEGANYRTVADDFIDHRPENLIQIPGLWVMVRAAELMSGVREPRSASVLVRQIAPARCFSSPLHSICILRRFMVKVR